MDAPDTTSPPPGYELQSPDSSFWAEALQFRRWRSMDLADKVQLAEDWHRAVHELHIESLRSAHPDASARDLERLAAEARYGREFLAGFLACERSSSP